MKYLKHKNMRDVCAGVVSHIPPNKYTIRWYNLLGAYKDKTPFMINAKTQDIQINEGWILTSDINDFIPVRK